MKRHLKLSIKNTDPLPKLPAVLYGGVPNTLVFTVTNDDSMLALTPDSEFRIDFPTDLLTTDQATKAKVPSDDKWHRTKVDQHGLHVSPMAAQTIEAGATLTFKLTDITPRQGHEKGKVVVSFFSDKSDKSSAAYAMKESLILQDPIKDGNDDLDDCFEVYTNGDADSTTLNSDSDAGSAVANTLTLKLAPKKRDQVLVENWPVDEPPTVEVSFAYGDDDDALTWLENPNLQELDPCSAWNIQCKLGRQKADWGIDRSEKKEKKAKDETDATDPDDATDPGPLWTFTPLLSNKHVLGGSEHVLFNFTEIRTVLPEGFTSVYIRWFNFPDYNDGFRAEDVYKQKLPQIKKFYSVPAEIESGGAQEVTLHWEVEHSKEQIMIGDHHNLPLSGHLPVKVSGSRQTFVLNCNYDNGRHSVSQTLTIPFAPPKIQFHATPHFLDFTSDTSNKIKLTWNASNASHVNFSPPALISGNQPTAGSDYPLTITNAQTPKLADCCNLRGLVLTLEATGLDQKPVPKLLLISVNRIPASFPEFDSWFKFLSSTIGRYDSMAELDSRESYRRRSSVEPLRELMGFKNTWHERILPEIESLTRDQLEIVAGWCQALIEGRRPEIESTELVTISQALEKLFNLSASHMRFLSLFEVYMDKHPDFFQENTKLPTAMREFKLRVQRLEGSLVTLRDLWLKSRMATIGGRPEAVKKIAGNIVDMIYTMNQDSS